MPPEARCSAPPDAGAGAAGAGAAVAETHWRTDWVRLCAQSTAPSTPDPDPLYLTPWTPCDSNTRGAVEAYADQSRLEVERQSSCVNDYAEGIRSQHHEGCTTSVDLDSSSVGDSCTTQRRSGDSGSGRWYWWSETVSSSSVTVGPDGVSIVRAGSEAGNESVNWSNRDEINVGPSGVSRTYVSDDDVGPDGNHCESSWALSTADPAATSVPPVVYVTEC